MNQYYIDRDHVHFKFPYNEDLVKKMKTLKAEYNFELKKWTIVNNLKTSFKISKVVKEFGFKQVGKKDLPEFKFNKNFNSETVIHSEKNSLDDIKDLINWFDFKMTPRPYQLDGIKYMLDFRKVINGSEMGCISGDMGIQVNRNKKGFKNSLRDVYLKFNGLKSNRSHNWSKLSPTYCKSFDETRGIFVKNEILNVLNKGVKKTLKVRLKSGKSIILTPDHEVITNNYKWSEIQKLSAGDIILSNGDLQCPNCGSTENIATYDKAKFKGYCRVCISRYLQHRHLKNGDTKDKDGYIYKSKQYNHPKSDRNYRVQEHILIVESNIGRYLNSDEVVHHINGKKDDNRIINLKLMTNSDHCKLHSQENYKNLENSKLVLVPREDEIISIEDNGRIDVYDIVMKNPHRNFVANKVIVHNCGKTGQAIAAVEIQELFPCLVICPSNIKYNWQKEWGKWVKDLPEINIIESGKNTSFIEDGVNIINYELLAERGDKSDPGYDPKEVSLKFKELKKIQWKCIICDESQKLKQNKSKQSKIVRMISKKAPYIFLLSGTPIMNRPDELYNQLMILGVFKTVFGTWLSFIQRFCDAIKTLRGWDYKGYSNLGELNSKLKSNCYFRVEKEDVLKGMPEVLESVLYFPITNEPTYKKAEHKLIEYIAETEGQEAAESASYAEHLVLRTKLEQLSQKGKIKNIIDWIQDYLEATDENIVVFGVYKEGLKKIADKFDAILIDGDMSSKKKQDSIDLLQKGGHRIVVGNIFSLGVGVDGLQDKFQTVLHVDISQKTRPADFDQANARVDRPGQTKKVSIYHAISDKTIDVDLWEVNEEKKKIADMVNKGKVTQREISIEKMLNKKLLSRNK